VGFYRGVVPPLWGSIVYRSLQFAVFEAAFTRAQELGYTDTIPGSGGVAYATVVAGVAASSSRTVVEQPIEYAKVKRQTGQTWHLREIYQGVHLQLPRTVGMLTSIFVLVDVARRKTDGEILKHPLGSFTTWGTASMLGFWIVWPLETLKNQVQAATIIEGTTSPTLAQRIRFLGGPLGLYRGILPGSISVFVRNGCAAVVHAARREPHTTTWNDC
jgi:solute carrier family 25 carnitine/acylcarnitine transporter 20/29